MPLLVIPKSYKNNQVLLEGDLDNIRDSLLTFFNTTKLDEDNIDVDALIGAITSTQADAIADAMSSTGADSIFSSISSSQANSIISDSTFSTDTLVTSDSSSLSSSEQTKCTLTVVSTGTYLISYVGGTSSAATEMTVKIKVDGSTQDTMTAVNLQRAGFLIQALTASASITLTTQRTSGSGTTQGSRLGLARLY